MKTLPQRLEVTRLAHRFVSNDRRVIARFFSPGTDSRIRTVIQRVLKLRPRRASTLLADILTNFESRHRDVRQVFVDHFEKVRQHVPHGAQLDDQRRLLIGAYFTMEYAIESAALFNPSIVEAPQQDGVPQGGKRFLMSLRATGEGHVSSIVFRCGVIDRDNRITFEAVSHYARRLKVVEDRYYEKKLFSLKLLEMGAFNDTVSAVLDRVGPRYTLAELNEAIDRTREELDSPEDFEKNAENMVWLARSNYLLEVPPDTDPSEIVIFPSTDDESRGIEDVRLVRFKDDNGSVQYYGTYTAFNGFSTLPQLIETKEFLKIKVHTLNGRYVQNKGLALFPRQVGGWYMMISRLDGENLYLMKSDNIRFWNEATRIQAPRFPWEFIQIGNCGSPLETDAGWLLLTHGVGPMRQYCIGASLLDRDDPEKVIGQLDQPLLVPVESERDGYVPNVVYTCGAMIHDDTLVIPYAVSDSATRFATVGLRDLLAHLTSHTAGRR